MAHRRRKPYRPLPDGPYLVLPLRGVVQRNNPWTIVEVMVGESTESVGMVYGWLPCDGEPRWVWVEDYRTDVKPTHQERAWKARQRVAPTGLPKCQPRP